MADRRTSAATAPAPASPAPAPAPAPAPPPAPSAAALAPPPAPIPPAPPPPPLKQKSRSYFERFVAQPLTTAYASRPPSVQAHHRPDGGPPNVLVPKLPGLRSGYSQDASHKTGLDISALDVNRERTHAVLAGREILKTVRVQDAKIVDDINLRAAVLNYTDSQVRQREGLGIHDVKWSHGQYSSYIATAAANGKVILYDLNRTSVELTRLHEHTRQVHKLAFNPHQGHLLLSASHDATVRLWDLRDMRRDVTSCRSRDQFAGVNGGIRDVQWSPTDAVEFAFGTDNGTIQRWDFRHNKGPKQKITAHEQRICTSIDWHPDGKHVLSAGVDRTVKVWDFSVTARRQKPVYVLTTPYPVHNARWRPPYWSDEYYEKGAYQCTQLATAYDREHPIIHVWDFRRPFLPFREINRFATAPTDMLWHSRDTLWTVGKEGVFQQNDVHHAPKTVDRRNLQSLAVSPSGEIAGVAQKRPRRRPSAGLAYPDDTYIGDPRDRRISPEKHSLRSSADDSIDDSFLTSSMKHHRGHHGRHGSSRSAKSFVATPPSDPAPKVMFLSDSMVSSSESTKPHQVAFRGILPGAPNAQIFSYLAQKYKPVALSDLLNVDSYIHLNQTFEQNAEYAQRAALYRLAQSWRIVGTSITASTLRRAELHREQRRQRKPATSPNPPSLDHNTLSEHLRTRDERLEAPANPAIRAIQGVHDKSMSLLATARPPTMAESTSNLTTPLARPVGDSGHTTKNHQKHQLLDLDAEHIDQLPPSVTGPPSLEMNTTLAPTSSAFKGPQWYRSADGLDQRRALVGSFRASPRIPLTFESEAAREISLDVPLPLERHDSGESFAMFSASTDSQKANSMPSSFASGRSPSRNVSSPSDGWRGSQTHSSFGGPRVPPILEHEPRRHSQISPTTIAHDKETADNGTSSQSPQHDNSNSKGFSMVNVSGASAMQQEMEYLRRNNQLLRHDSSESEAFTNTTSSSFDYAVEMEASGTIVPEAWRGIDSTHTLKPPTLQYTTTASVSPAIDPTSAESLLLSDFQALHVNPEEGSPFTMIGLLTSLLSYHTNASDAQFSSFLILLLAPLLPQTQQASETRLVDVSEILAMFTETFVSLGLTPVQAKAILETQLEQLVATGINPYQAESILSAYHAQLHSLSLFNSATSIRRLSYPVYPAVYEQALKDTQLGLLCLSCKSPINNPKDKMRCETCKRAQAPCPICWAKYPAFEPVTSKKKVKLKVRSGIKDRGHKRNRSSCTSIQAFDADHPCNTDSPKTPVDWSPSAAYLWTWCPLCGHGGHTNCISTWLADPVLSDGACPTEGCLCDCVQGKRRSEKIQKLVQKKVDKERSKVVRKGDDWKVNESQAVSAVRSTLDSGQERHRGLGATNHNNDRKRAQMPVRDHDEPASGSGPSQGSSGSTFGRLPKS
ncbi:SEA (Seh1-associated) complex subunit [Coniothyrium glycines]